MSLVVHLLNAGELEIRSFFCHNGWPRWYLRSWQSRYEVCWNAV